MASGFSASLSVSQALADDPIKVGCIFPMSGGAGPVGQSMAKAVQAMAALINQDGGVMGRQIELLIRDDESTPAVGAAKAGELISQGVSVIVEGFNSPVTLAMQPVIARADILDITVSAKADSILGNKANPLAIRMNSSGALDGEATADYIANKLKAKRIAFATENDAYGKSTQQGIEDSLKKLNWNYEIVSQQLFPFSQTDFRVTLSNIKAANPDAAVLINASDTSGMPAMIQQYRQMEIPATMVMTVGQVSQPMIDVMGAAANGLRNSDIYVATAEPYKSNPQHQRFVDELQKQFKTFPDKHMALAGAALQTWALTANAEKSLDRKVLAGAIQGHTIHGTLLGDITFGPNGQLQHTYRPFTVVDGKIAAGE